MIEELRIWGTTSYCCNMKYKEDEVEAGPIVRDQNSDVLVCHAKKLRLCPIGSEASPKNVWCFPQFQNTLKMKKSKKTK